MILNETYALNNGVAIPKLALGTWLVDDAVVADAVRAAIEIGYRHVDTAHAYGNKRGVGEGVRTSGVARDELFVVSKVAAEHKSYEAAVASINRTLAKMGLDYLDMMIIHSPQPWVEVNQFEDCYHEGNVAAYRSLVLCRDLEVDRRVLAHARGLRGLGQRHHAKLDDVADAELRHGNAVLRGHLGDALDAPRLAVRDGRVRLHLDAVVGAEVSQLEGHVAHVREHLVDRRHDRAVAKDVAQVLRLEVRHADGAQLAGCQRVFEHALNATGGLPDYGDHSFFPVFGGKL